MKSRDLRFGLFELELYKALSLQFLLQSTA